MLSLLVILSRPYCPSPPPPESLTESHYESPTTSTNWSDACYTGVCIGRGAETVVQYSLSPYAVSATQMLHVSLKAELDKRSW
jgi:hypothetical protein